MRGWLWHDRNPLFWLGDRNTHTQLLRLCLFLSRLVFLCDHWVITWLAASSIKHELQTCKCRLCLVLTTGVSVCMCVCVCACVRACVCVHRICFPFIVYVSSRAMHSCSTALHFKRPGVVLATLYLHWLEVRLGCFRLIRDVQRDLPCLEIPQKTFKLTAVALKWRQIEELRCQQNVFRKRFFFPARIRWNPIHWYILKITLNIYMKYLYLHLYIYWLVV